MKAMTIGEIAESLRLSIETLAHYIGEIDSVMGQLAEVIWAFKQRGFQGRFFPIQESISTFVQNLTQVVKGIARASEQVSAGSQQVSSGAQSLAQGSRAGIVSRGTGSFSSGIFQLR